MLTLKNIVVHYGGVQALKGISLEVQEGAVTALIGANGAGKSTTLRAISGLVPLTSGEILFEGKRIDGKSPEKIVALGIVQVPEGKRLFLEMSVLDNLLAGAYLRKDTDRLATDLEHIYGYFPILGKARHRPASNLSGGEQQMLAIGRGLMASPRLLLLDEPSLGLSPLLTKEVGAIIKQISDEGVSILLIEQNASLALQLAQKAYVMETGTIALEGDPLELQNNAHVKEAYLGLSPTEEVPIAGIQSPQTPLTSMPAMGAQTRWQDRGPQGRWQDKVVQEELIPSEKRREEPVRERQVKEKEVPRRLPQERWTVERWPEDRHAQERSVSARRLVERRKVGKWLEDRELLERWPEEKRIRDRKPPSRVVKKTFMPVVRNVSRALHN
ncbi:MAG: ABC transporter ATP-binding protein [Desulfobacteraceae bacterium]|nr:MAG: ABC transporter ATP-binding protein [Desulfobacteraceae bacterium]